MPEVATEQILTLRSICRIGAANAVLRLGRSLALGVSFRVIIKVSVKVISDLGLVFICLFAR